MLGSYNRLNQVAVNFAPTLQTFTDDRIDAEKLSYKAVHGSVTEVSTKAILWALDGDHDAGPDKHRQ